MLYNCADNRGIHGAATEHNTDGQLWEDLLMRNSHT